MLLHGAPMNKSLVLLSKLNVNETSGFFDCNTLCIIVQWTHHSLFLRRLNPNIWWIKCVYREINRRNICRNNVDGSSTTTANFKTVFTSRGSTENPNHNSSIISVPRNSLFVICIRYPQKLFRNETRVFVETFVGVATSASVVQEPSNSEPEHPIRVRYGHRSSIDNCQIRSVTQENNKTRGAPRTPNNWR